jgi:hypothetical protein
MEDTQILRRLEKEVNIYDNREVLDFIKENQFHTTRQQNIKISFRTNLKMVANGLRHSKGDVFLQCNSHQFNGRWTLRGAGLLHLKGRTKPAKYSPFSTKDEEFAGWLHVQADGSMEGCIHGLPVEAYNIKLEAGY